VNMCEKCYWRFRGEREWRYGWPTNAGDGLVMMGRWNGDKSMGVIVSPSDIEIWKST